MLCTVLIMYYFCYVIRMNAGHENPCNTYDWKLACWLPPIIDTVSMMTLLLLLLLQLLVAAYGFKGHVVDCSPTLEHPW